jgi:hypothetical protein
MLQENKGIWCRRFNEEMRVWGNGGMLIKKRKELVKNLRNNGDNKSILFSIPCLTQLDPNTGATVRDIVC